MCSRPSAIADFPVFPSAEARKILGAGDPEAVRGAVAGGDSEGDAEGDSEGIAPD
ncbi:hypothetical protein GCM10023353_31450 [Tomitella cavernea]|uniref:Uncharacterized protein n=1 Tax=Tomitella cavernea TaxID=1387982 RepID=A0ABP9CX71_9ACTN